MVLLLELLWIIPHRRTQGTLVLVEVVVVWHMLPAPMLLIRFHRITRDVLVLLGI